MVDIRSEVGNWVTGSFLCLGQAEGQQHCRVGGVRSGVPGHLHSMLLRELHFAGRTHCHHNLLLRRHIHTCNLSLTTECTSGQIATLTQAGTSRGRTVTAKEPT